MESGGDGCYSGRTPKVALLSLRSNLARWIDKPVLTLELRRNRAWRWKPLWCLASLLPLVGYVLMGPAVSPVARFGLFVMLVFFQGLMIVLCVPIYAGRSISSEREQGSLEMLALTPLSSAEIVDQKFAAVLLQALPLCVLSFPAALAVAYSGGMPWWAAAIELPLALLTVVGLGYLSIWMACVCKEHRTALVIVYALVFCVGNIVVALLVLGSFILRMAAVSSFDKLRSVGYAPFRAAPLSGSENTE